MPIKRGVPGADVAGAGVERAYKGKSPLPALLRSGKAEGQKIGAQLGNVDHAAPVPEQARVPGRRGGRDVPAGSGAGTDDTQTIRELISEDEMKQLEARAARAVKEPLTQLVKWGLQQSILHLMIMDRIASGGNGAARINPMIRASRSFQEDLIKLHESGMDRPASEGKGKTSAKA